MPRFAANLGMLWPDIDVYDRFDAAARAGFHSVEMLFVHPLELGRIRRALHKNDLNLELFDPAPGNWADGERGLMCLGGREGEFLQTVVDAIASAVKLGTRRLNVLTGLVGSTTPREDAVATARENLRAAATVAAAAGGVTLLIENINSVEWPGYLTDTAEKAADLIDSVGEPNVRMQLDAYHVAMMGADPIAQFHRFSNLIDHIQVADVPGRHEPGTGSAGICEFLRELDLADYRGCVGLEYRPLADTDQGLKWMHSL